tara:strand:+ start:478 stop:2454 length:1977 start_codon:yes stop_codon:yes gene_type:complete
MWQSLLKALPNPESIAGMLHREEAIDVILTQAKGEDKTNIIVVRNKARRLSQKKDLPKGFDDDQLKEMAQNAEKLAKELTKLIKELNKDAQTTLEGKLNQIIEEEDIGGLKEFVTENSIRKWPNKTRKEKVKLLKDNKEAIIDFIGEDNIDFFYYNTSNFRLMATKAPNDTDWKSKTDKIKNTLKDTDIQVEGEDTITLIFPKITSPDNLQRALSLAQLRTKRGAKTQSGTKEYYLAFTKQGKAIKSPLVELFSLDTTQQVKDKVEGAESKEYKSNVSTSEDALAYLDFLVGQGVRNKTRFMPEPNIGGGKGKFIKNAKLQLLGSTSKPKISSSLRALFITRTFDLESLMKEGTTENQKKYIAPRMRTILESNKDEEIGGVSAGHISDLKDLFRVSPGQKEKGREGEFPRFVRKLKGKNLTNFTTLNRFLIGIKPNLFAKEEVDLIVGLSEKSPVQIKKELAEYYKTPIQIYIARILWKALQKDVKPFEQVEGGYTLKVKGLKFEEQKDLVTGLKLIRQKMSGEKQEAVTVNLKQSLSTYSKKHRMSESGSPEPSDMLHFLYILDLYYGRTGFKSLASQLRRGEIEAEDVLESAKDNFDAIMNSFVEKVKDKINHILENKEEYQQALAYQGESRAYIIFEKLKDRGLIVSLTETTRED